MFYIVYNSVNDNNFQSLVYKDMSENNELLIDDIFTNMTSEFKIKTFS